MSGTGSRFLRAGYKNIKPLVRIFDKQIVRYIVEKFSPSDNFIFICRKEHLNNPEIELKLFLKTLAKNVKVCAVGNHKLGPVHSITEIKNELNLNDEIIVNYCDFDWRWDYSAFKKWLSIEKPISAICAYIGFHPHYINPAPYAHIKCEQHNLTKIKEKASYTKYRHEEPAASGTFYFKSAKILLDACNWLKEKNETINNEFYVSLIFNYFPEKNLRCLVYYIENFMQWGTPEDLNEFRFFARKVPFKFKRQEIDSTALLLMAGQGNRMKEIDKIKKPYLKISNKYLYDFCTQNFYSKENNILVISGDEQDKEFLKKETKFSNTSVGFTKSSVETLLKFLENNKLENSKGILIMPCDASIDLNWNKFLEFLNNKEQIDGIVFSYKNYPLAKWMPNQYSWLEEGSNNKINKIGLKKGWNNEFSNPIVTGYFWFPNIGKLKNRLEKFKILKMESEKELSIDEFCNFLIQKNRHIYFYPVNDFLCLGVPYEFRAYEYWFNANEKLRFN